ncbi:MAG: AI-2E family transporter [Desulfobacteraceae bacterium]|nr:AI-2E family transporter [Desulfobacteraceae bacterium]MCF8095991.1 AI-2E family transporter [Desulfobacteraceae bacterium]
MLQMMRDWFNHRFADPQVIILWVILLGGLVGVLLLGEMLQPVFVGLIIAYLLEGVVARLESIRIPRSISVAITFTIFMICLLALVIGLLPLLSRQIAQLIQELPALISNGQKQLMQLPERYPELVSEEQIRQVIGFLKTELTSIGQNVVMFSVASVKNLITLLIYLVLVPLLVLFFLKDKSRILRWFQTLLPKNLELTEEVWREVNEQVGNFIRGKIWEIIIVWVVSYITFSLLDLNFAMLISLFIGLSVLIPYIGATVMTIPVVLLAFFQWGISHEFTYTIIAYGVIQIIDGNILVPLLLSGVVNLHPIAIIVAILVFGGIWGLWGLFLAIPLATLVHAVIKTWFSKKPSKKPDY